MWLVRQLRYGRRLITRIERMYQRRWGARRFQSRVASAPVKRLVLGASSKHDRGWIPTEMGYLNLLNSEHWEPGDGSRHVGRHARRARLGASHAG